MMPALQRVPGRSSMVPCTGAFGSATMAGALGINQTSRQDELKACEKVRGRTSPGANLGAARWGRHDQLVLGSGFQTRARVATFLAHDHAGDLPDLVFDPTGRPALIHRALLRLDQERRCRRARRQAMVTPDLGK